MSTTIIPGDVSITYRSEAARPTVAAVIVTRNRIPMLRQTLKAIRQSRYTLSEIIVSDDSTNDETAEMLSAEFPEVIHIKGPKRGISANRNRGISIAKSDFILLSDDDILLDPTFVGSGLQKAQESKASLVFSAIDDAGTIVLPNTLDFLGFSTKPYPPGRAYNTANQQCFLVTRELAQNTGYDEVIEAYGYEEMDFAYRVAAAGHRIECVPTCTNVHLAPMSGPQRQEKNASRIYVTYKRLAYVDRRVLTAFAFLVVALPHHLIGSFRRNGMRGAMQALVHFRLAQQMLVKYRKQSGATLSN